MEKGKMVEILNFFDPLELKDFHDTSFVNDEYSLGNNMAINSTANPISENTKVQLAFFTVEQSFSKSKNDLAYNPQIIREEIYRLSKVSSGMNLADLGKLRTGKSMNDMLFAIQEVCALLFHQNITVIVVGHPQLLTLGCFRGLKEFENNINLVNVDSKIDLSTSESSNNEVNYLNQIIDGEASHLYNITCLAYQSYFVHSKQLKLLDENHFEHYRLGNLRNDFSNTEPVFRDADIVSFDIASVRMTDAPGQTDGSPNGLYADEACLLSRYAGIGNRCKVFGLFNVNTKLDNRSQTSKLAAQIFWYFIEGFKHRKNDDPNKSIENCTKYEVQIDEIDFPIVFFKNKQTNRWWIEVKSLHANKNMPEQVIVSCSEADYKLACSNEIPDRWWLNFKKMK